MPLGSSSEAPVTSPAPSCDHQRRSTPASWLDGPTLGTTSPLDATPTLEACGSVHRSCRQRSPQPVVGAFSQAPRLAAMMPMGLPGAGDYRLVLSRSLSMPRNSTNDVNRFQR